MSKSTGNSLTLKEAIEKFGADAGDGLEDANFEKTTNANILKVFALLGWCEVGVLTMVAIQLATLRFSSPILFLLLNSTNYKDALKYGFCELQSARGWYREITLGVWMHSSLATYWIRTAALLINQPSSVQLTL
jgi:leucyl-tRNA synthetase